MDSISKIASPDAHTHTNEKGGKQSDIPVRFDLIDGKAMFAMAQVLDHGAKKYGANNWRQIDVDDHLNHLLMHTYAYLSGDRTDDHLSHILCRATFANGVALAEQPVKEDGKNYLEIMPNKLVIYNDSDSVEVTDNGIIVESTNNSSSLAKFARDFNINVTSALVNWFVDARKRRGLSNEHLSSGI